MKFEIMHRWNNTVKVVLEGESRDAAIKKAIQDKVDLRGSNLSDSDLRGSNLSGSDLRGSDLSGSNLRGSDLSDSNLSGSDLSGSDLSGSNLRDSDLRDSDLSGSNLRGSNLSGSNLRDSNLSGSDLEPIRDDLWAVLSAAPHEVKGLRQAIIDGKIDGSTYEGKCACLVGTIAKVAGKGHRELPILKPNANRPAEAFFTAIKPGNTPQTNQASKLALEWIDEWLKNIEEAFAK